MLISFEGFWVRCFFVGLTWKQILFVNFLIIFKILKKTFFSPKNSQNFKMVSKWMILISILKSEDSFRANMIGKYCLKIECL